PAEFLAASPGLELVVGAFSQALLSGEPTPIELGPAEPEPCQARERDQRTAVAEHDGHAEGDFPRPWYVGAEELLLPGGGDVDRETGAELARCFRHRPVVGVSIDGGRRRIDPQGGRMLAVRYRPRQLSSGLHPGAEDLGPVCCVVAAVDALAGQVDE